MKILVNGCSHSLGTQLSLPDSQDRYSVKLADSLGAEVNNIALSGGSNDRIYRETINEICRVKYDLVILQWTDISRFETPTRIINDEYHNVHSTDKWLQHRPRTALWPTRDIDNIKWRDFYKDNWDIETKDKQKYSDLNIKLHKKLYSQIIGLNAYINSLGIRTINLSWDPLTIDDSMYKEVQKLEWPIACNYGIHHSLSGHGYDYCKKTRFPNEPGGSQEYDGHYMADGHFQLYTWIMDYLETGTIITRNHKKHSEPDNLAHVYEWG